MTFGATYSQSAAARTSDEVEGTCPVISVSCPSDPKPNEPVRYTGKVTGGNPIAEPIYHWTVSHGEIVEGQGTLAISVKTSDAQSLTATLTVSGYNKKCATTASCSTPIICRVAPPAQKFDSYGRLTTQATNLRLDQFLAALNNHPGAQGYILGYHDRSSPPGAAEKAIMDAKKYLISLGVEDSRIVTKEAGLDEEFRVELWVVPAGTVPPLGAPADPVLGKQSSVPERP